MDGAPFCPSVIGNYETPAPNDERVFCRCQLPTDSLSNQGVKASEVSVRPDRCRTA